MNYMVSNPNDIQHGGDHYKKAGNAQHWDMLAILGFGWEYYIGAATKYLTRVKDQDKDPRKAAHFIDKLIWLIDNAMVPETFRTVQGKRQLADAGNTPYSQRVDVESWLYDVYFPANNLQAKGAEAQIILHLMLARTGDDLRAARKLMAYLLGEATEDYVDQDQQATSKPAAERLAEAMTTANAAAVSGRTVAAEVAEDRVLAEGGGTDAQAAQAAAGAHDGMIADYDKSSDQSGSDDARPSSTEG